MIQLKNLKLRNKMIFYILSVSFIVLSGILGYVILEERSIIKDATFDYTQAKSNEFAKTTSLFLERPISVARSFSITLEGFKGYGETNRDFVLSIMKHLLEENPDFLGIWTVWEPNAFDGRDKEFKGKPGHDSSGRFIPYVTRVGNTISSETCLGYDNVSDSNNFYQIPFKQNKEFVCEPYEDNVQGTKMLMVTMSVPLHFNNSVVGVVGVDISVKKIYEMFKGTKLFESGFTKIISNKGKILSDIDEPEIGKLTGEFKKIELIDAKNAIQAGKEYSYVVFSDHFNSDALKSYSPIFIGDSKENPWSFVSIVSVNEALLKVSAGTRTTLFAGFIGLILLALALWIMANTITKPILKGVEFAKEIASGNLNAQIDVSQNDEIGELIKSLNEMGVNLKDIVSNINNSADSIAQASSQLSVSSQQLSQGATQQASAAEEVSSSMEEMVANIQQTADNAKQTESITISAAEGIIEGNRSSEISIKAMNEIAGKIGIIGDIAFQTNILALNAAVEAARAGEHGRGFAVVAAEVRKLAERSKVAADQINELSKSGVEVSREAGLKLSVIIPEVEKTVKLVQEISSASMEQSSGADQVNSALQQLNDIIQQNAATSEEMATNSEEMYSQADQLREYLKFFKIDGLDSGSKSKHVIHKQDKYKPERNNKLVEYSHSKQNLEEEFDSDNLEDLKPVVRKNTIVKKSFVPNQKVSIPERKGGVKINLTESRLDDKDYERF